MCLTPDPLLIFGKSNNGSGVKFKYQTKIVLLVRQKT
jgi:hypothetical protein